MPVLRLLFAVGVAFVAICATLFAGALVIFTGIVGYVLQLFRGKSAPRPTAPRRRSPAHGDAIDIEATQVKE